MTGDKHMLTSTFGISFCKSKWNNSPIIKKKTVYTSAFQSKFT